MIEKNNFFKKFNVAEGIIIFLSILLKYLIIHETEESIIYIYLVLVILFTFGIIFQKKFQVKEFLKIIFFLGLSLYFVIMYKDVNLFISVLMAVICLNRRNDDFIKIFLVSSLILYTGNILLNLIGIIPSQNMVRNTTTGVIVRYDLGFGHPNQVFLFLLPIIFSGYYLYNNKKSFYVISLIISIIFYKLSYCRTGMMCILFLLFAGWFQTYKGFFKKNKMLKYIFLIFTLSSLFIAVQCGNDVQNPLNKVLSNRPYCWNWYNKNNLMFSLFGHNFNPKVTIDNFYIYILVDYGIVGYIIYFLVYNFSIKKIKSDYKLCLILLIFLMYGLFETNVIIGSIQFVFAIQIKSLIQASNQEYEEGL